MGTNSNQQQGLAGLAGHEHEMSFSPCLFSPSQIMSRENTNSNLSIPSFSPSIFSPSQQQPREEISSSSSSSSSLRGPKKRFTSNHTHSPSASNEHEHEFSWSLQGLDHHAAEDTHTSILQKVAGSSSSSSAHQGAPGDNIRDNGLIHTHGNTNTGIGRGKGRSTRMNRMMVTQASALDFGGDIADSEMARRTQGGGGAMGGIDMYRHGGLLPDLEVTMTQSAMAHNNNSNAANSSINIPNTRNRSSEGQTGTYPYQSPVPVPVMVMNDSKSPKKPKSVGSASPGNSGFLTGSKCNCKKSKCLKLYCECFSNLRYCESCNCMDCNNTKNHEVSLIFDGLSKTLKWILLYTVGVLFHIE